VFVAGAGVEAPFVEMPLLALLVTWGPVLDTHGEGAVRTGTLDPPRPGNDSSDCVSNTAVFALPEEGPSFRFPAALADIGAAHPGVAAGSSVDSRILEDTG
jgi:hypothetical protein